MVGVVGGIGLHSIFGNWKTNWNKAERCQFRLF